MVNGLTGKVIDKRAKSEATCGERESPRQEIPGHFPRYTSECSLSFYIGNIPPFRLVIVFRLAFSAALSHQWLQIAQYTFLHSHRAMCHSIHHVQLSLNTVCLPAALQLL